MQRKRKKLYPAVIIVTLPEELKKYLSNCSDEIGKAENAIIREYIENLRNEEIDLKELKKFCY